MTKQEKRKQEVRENYFKVLAIIKSCRTSRQNNTAYAVVQRFEKMYGESWHCWQTSHLYDVCDSNMFAIMQGEFK